MLDRRHQLQMIEKELLRIQTQLARTPQKEDLKDLLYTQNQLAIEQLIRYTQNIARHLYPHISKHNQIFHTTSAIRANLKPELYAMFFLLTQTSFRYDKLLLEILKFAHIKTDATGHQEDFEKEIQMAHRKLCKALSEPYDEFTVIEEIYHAIQELKPNFPDIAYWDDLPDYLVKMNEPIA